jgi:predicted ATPase
MNREELHQTPDWLPMVKTLAIANYRSLRELVVNLDRLNLISGPNGSGKSNLYRALRLLAETASGGFASSLAREGGISSSLWAGAALVPAGTSRGDYSLRDGARKPTTLYLGFQEEDYGYAIQVGYPIPRNSPFDSDPEIKTEFIWHGEQLRSSTLLVERRGAMVQIRRDIGWEIISTKTQPYESMLEQISDPTRAPEVMVLRDQIRTWRFYDYFRTDEGAPARQPQVGTYSPVLSHDGSNLAAAISTIQDIGDHGAFANGVADAFPGASVAITRKEDRFYLNFWQRGLLRPLGAHELSDGTIRYLLWSAALLTPRPPRLMILNEPETSLHPELLPALGRLIAFSSKNSQICVVSHSKQLIEELERQPSCNSIRLDKKFGETTIPAQASLERPAWHW